MNKFDDALKEILKKYSPKLGKSPYHIRLFLEGVSRVHAGDVRRDEFNLFLIPDGNARSAMLELPNIKESRDEYDLKTLSSNINRQLKDPKDYLKRVRKEYLLNAYASTLIAGAVTSLSAGDVIVCVYNEVNKEDRVYFDIFERMLNKIGQETVDYINNLGIKTYVVGKDADYWTEHVKKLTPLKKNPVKGEPRVIIVTGLQSKPHKALKRFDKLGNEDLKKQELRDSIKGLIGDFVDENLERFGRDCHMVFRATHARISGMYSSIINDATFGFSLLPFRYYNFSELALQLVGSHAIDEERLSRRLDVYRPKEYLSWWDYWGNRSTHPQPFNVVLPSKRNVPIFSNVQTISEKALLNAWKS